MKTDRSFALSRPRPLAAALAAPLLVALASGCGDPPAYESAPLDRFTFPAGLAIAPGGDLLVVSSNFELTYAEKDGGSLIRVDAAPTPAAIRSGVRLPSYGGQVRVADATACGLPTSEALVVARSSTDLLRISIDADGQLACGPDCRVRLGPAADVATDPYSVSVVCVPGRAPRAFVGFLSSPSTSGWISEIDLSTRAVVSRQVALGAVRSFAYDAAHARLFFTGGIVPQAPLRWLELGGGCSIDVGSKNPCPLAARDLSAFVRGADLTGLALSNEQDGLVRRAYVAARLYDADLAAILGGRPGFDVGGVLLVLDLVERRSGDIEIQFVRAVSIGKGAGEVAVLPARARGACADPAGCPRRDVVAITSSEEGILWLYDDEIGAVVKAFGSDPATGHPITGRQPFALAVEDVGGGEALVFVASFNEAFVTPFRVPLEDPGAADADPPGPGIRRIGAEVP